jgi:hypothetical protein
MARGRKLKTSGGANCAGASTVMRLRRQRFRNR